MSRVVVGAPLAHLRWDAADGAPLAVLLHGIGGGRNAWSDELSGTGRALCDAGFEVAAVDLPGYGDSAAIDPYTMAGVAQRVASLIDALGAGRAILVGHSLGGMVAQELCALAPERVQALVLVGTSSAFGKPGGAWQQQFLADRFAPLDAGRGMPELAASLVAGMLGPQAPASTVAAATRLMAAVPEATYRQALTALTTFDRRAQLAHIDVPTLCITGEHDRNAPPSLMQQMAMRIRGAEYLCLAGAGHLAPMEAPDPFNRALLAFVQRRCGAS
jgi:3-oxoadipate enol-lactonase